MSDPLHTPPDRAEQVVASSVLVLAPHPDDEVLGCGGLVAQLAARGAAVRVLFLTDGGGGVAPAERSEYVATRRREAAAVADLLGLAGVEHLDLPDGGLGEHLEAAATAVRRALLSQRPELLLVPSPLEISRDHRAAFAALHRLLGPLRARGGDRALAELAAELRILVYEINHPAHPDLLVDVGDELPRLAAAMELYRSQGERAGYWRAAQGLKRFRTLTLGDDREGPAAAEGYRRLAAADFTTRSPAQLVAHLGGLAELHEVREGPRISVVVRTLDRPALLAEALASLAASTYRRAEVVLVNDGGEPPQVPEDFPLPVVRVDLEETGGRAAAADAGVAAAGGDVVTFLDDDDLAAPEHLATLAGLAAAAGVRVAYSDAAVGVYELTGPGDPGETGGWRCVERRLPYSRDFDPDLLLVDNYIPFNTVVVERALLAEVGPFDRELPFFEDWDLLIRLAARSRFHHLAAVTCEYRHFRGGGHHVLGDAPRRRADFLAMKERVLAKHAERLSPAALARVVDTLRAEQVDAAEAAALADRRRREAALDHREAARRAAAQFADLEASHQQLAERYHQLDQRYHELNGELDALRGERQAMAVELERLYAAEAALRAVVADQDAHLGRTYGEIERLGGRIREMEGSRVWRLHLQLERLRGAMTRIALVSSEPIRERMAGIGLRYLELARRLPAASRGVETVLVSPAEPDVAARAVAAAGAAGAPLPEPAGRCPAASPRPSPACDGAVAQGQLANDLVLELPGCPWRSTSTTPGWSRTSTTATARPRPLPQRPRDLGAAAVARRLLPLLPARSSAPTTWASSTALGRVHPGAPGGGPRPPRAGRDRALRGPGELPPHRPYLPPPRPGERRGAPFGGLYDWYDPWTLLRRARASRRRSTGRCC